MYRFLRRVVAGKPVVVSGRRGRVVALVSAILTLAHLAYASRAVSVFVVTAAATSIAPTSVCGSQ